jgi:hypothetical protein
LFRGFGRGHCWGGDQQYTVAAAVAVTCCASCSAVDDRFEALVSHNGLDRAVHVRVPDVRAEDARQRGLAEAPLADDAALRDRYRTRLADPALEPYDECTGCTSACLFRRRSQSIMSETGTGKAFLDLITEHGWARGADRADELAGSGTLDEQVCLVIHAFRAAYPPGRWTPTTHDTAADWAATARAELTRSEPDERAQRQAEPAETTGESVERRRSESAPATRLDQAAGELEGAADGGAQADRRSGTVWWH